MGNQLAKLCGNPPKPTKPPKSQVVPGTPKQVDTALQIPNFMNPNLAKSIQKRENLFEGLVSTYHGELRQQWIPITQKFYYKGEWSGSKIHGHGYLYDTNEHSLLIGCFYENNLIPAKYRKIFSNQTQYVGQINQAFEMHGNGKVTGKIFKYEGQLKNSKFDGEGKLDQGEVAFKGTFSKGLKLKGVQTTKKGTYEGSFENDQRQGVGVFTWTDGGRFQGTFKKNKIHGKGKLYDREGCFCGNHTFEQGKLLI